ncbi:MAG: hypothetical protein VX265_13190, partial [Myxococcota bacterium]|nr:hypothetical protein [Myxococcota bacterium]
MHGSPLLVSMLASLAHGHGGLHQSTALEFGPAGPILETTYGVIRLADDGEWSWICEEVSGVAGDGWTFSVGPDGRMWFTGIGGANTSTDHCSWAALEGAPAERFITSIVPDATRPGVVWATTGNGGVPNPLLRADDGGLSFADGPVLDDDARLRRLAVAPDGRIWVQGMIDSTVWVWTSPDGADWRGTSVVEVDRGVELVDVGPDGSAWVRTRTSVGDGLYRVSPGLDVALIYETGSSIDGVSAGPGRDEVWLGGRDLVLQGTQDGGGTWMTAEDAPSVGCLVRHGGVRWMCSDNWVDGAALSQVTVGGELGPWTPVLWFGDVQRVEPCAAGTATAQECGPLWAALDPQSGMDLEDSPADGVAADSG